MQKIIDIAENVVEKIVKCRMLYYIVAIIMFITVYYYDLKNKLAEMNLEGNHLKYYLIAAIASAIVALILIILSKKMYEKLKIHLVYIILALILGGMYVFAIPLCAQSDEPAHIYRAFQVATGEIISPIDDVGYRAELPKSLIDVVNTNSENKKREHKKYYDIKEMSEIELNKEDTEVLYTAGTYHGIIYLPHAIGINIGMLLKLNPYYTAMLGRITGLIIAVLLYAWGIKKLPKYKLFATIILLSPVVLSYAAAFSADPITLALIFLLISYVLNYMITKEKIRKREYVLLTLLAISVAIVKIAYLPIIGILIFIPKECYGNNKKIRWIIPILLIILGIGTSLWWMHETSTNIVQGEGYSNKWIYTNPLGYATVLFRTTISSWYSYIENIFAGYYLCHNQVNPYSVIPFAYIAITLCAIFNEENKEKITTIQKVIAVGIMAVVYALVSTAMYIANTAYKSPTIIGVQGRYLIPILLMAVFLFKNKRINVEERELTNIAILVNFAVYLAMITKFIA